MATESTAGEAVGGAGMPQLDFSTFPNQIFWLVVTLVVIYLLLTRVSLPRIGAILAQRQGMITNDIAAAEDLKQKAVAAEQAYNQALADARAEAGRIIAVAKADIQTDVDAATARADAELSAQAAQAEGRIGAIRASALAAISEVARDTAEALVAALGGKADPAAITAAVTARLKG